MVDWVVNIPVWHVHYVKAEIKEEALEKAQKQNLPSDISGMDDVSIEVNEEAI